MNNRRKLLIAICAGALVVLSLLGYLIWSSYGEAIQAAAAKTKDYSAIIHERLDATLHRINGDMRNLATRIPSAALSKQEV